MMLKFGDMNYDNININVAYFTLFKKVNGNRTGIYVLTYMPLHLDMIRKITLPVSTSCNCDKVVYSILLPN